MIEPVAAAGQPRQPGLWILLSPKWRTAMARVRQERSGAGMRLLLLTLAGFGFWSAVFGVSYRVLKYFQGVPDIGTLVATKLLAVLLLAFLGVLLLSNIITALSTYFLASDLDIMVSAPVDWLRVYIAKLAETTVHSSWMVILVAVLDPGVPRIPSPKVILSTPPVPEGPPAAGAKTNCPPS